MKRTAAFAGSFYPASADRLKNEIEELMNSVTSNRKVTDVRAIIVPHAGYVYSGTVAAAAYQQVYGQSYTNVFLIGVSHRYNFKGVATVDVSAFETPLGDVRVNQQLISVLSSQNELFFKADDIHKDEHTLEVQLPFMKELIAVDCGIVPLLVGANEKNELFELAASLGPYFSGENLFVFSTDFSHYPSAVDAELEDHLTADVICANNYDLLVNHLNKQNQSDVSNLQTGLCGWRAVLLLLALTEGKEVKFEHLLYENSGMKLNKDTSRVVGYHAIAVVEDKTTSLSVRAEKYLLAVAHQAIETHLGLKSDDIISDCEYLLPASGVFVSVYCGNELRGCIGQFESTEALDVLVKEQAVNAAFFDSRFKAIKVADLSELKIEISVLTPLKTVADINEIELGRHGIYIKKGMQHGTFLPQVGARNNWTVEEFLGYCAKNKARIGWEGWKDAELYTYEALIISDKDD